jgi:hypothetical protein
MSADVEATRPEGPVTVGGSGGVVSTTASADPGSAVTNSTPTPDATSVRFRRPDIVVFPLAWC